MALAGVDPRLHRPVRPPCLLAVHLPSSANVVIVEFVVADRVALVVDRCPCAMAKASSTASAMSSSSGSAWSRGARARRRPISSARRSPPGAAAWGLRERRGSDVGPGGVRSRCRSDDRLVVEIGVRPGERFEDLFVDPGMNACRKEGEPPVSSPLPQAARIASRCQPRGARTEASRIRAARLWGRWRPCRAHVSGPGSPGTSAP